MAEVKTTKATQEQLQYAWLLDIGMKVGMLMLFVTFAIYMLGIMKPHVPVEQLPQLWTMSVHEYLQVAGIEPGWGWLSMLNNGDFVNFIGIAFLAGVTIICYIRILPTLLNSGDKVYMILAVLEVLVLVLAASGLLKSGGH